MGLTGGMFSVYRGLLGTWFLIFFASHLPVDAAKPDPFGPLAWLLGFLPENIASPLHLYLGCFLSLMFALGRGDRICAWLLILVFPWLSMETVNPMTPAGFLLFLHLFVPVAPFGSQAALGRVDPGGEWTFSPSFQKVGWLFMAATWAAGLVALMGASDWVMAGAVAYGFPTDLPGFVIGFLIGVHSGAVAALLSDKKRFFIWTLLFAVHLLLVVFALGFMHVPMLLLLMLLFEWDWLPPQKEPDLLFYDGACGMCHRASRFVIAEDAAGTCFEIAPLEGETFAELIPKDVAADLPDSIIIRRRNGELLYQSRAALLILDHLGGLWRVAAWLGRLIPRPLLDMCYNGVARVRHRFFAKPADVCPVLPPHLRKRFRW